MSKRLKHQFYCHMIIVFAATTFTIYDNVATLAGAHRFQQATSAITELLNDCCSISTRHFIAAAATTETASPVTARVRAVVVVVVVVVH